MKIYFAGSIRGGRNDKQLYADIINTLSPYGVVLTEHVGDQKLTAFGEYGPTDQYIYNRDMNWLKEADVVVAEVSTPSLGVGYELAKAEEWGKKILCLYRETRGKRLSAMVAGSGSLEIIKYKSLGDLKGVLKYYLEKLIKHQRV